MRDDDEPVLPPPGPVVAQLVDRNAALEAAATICISAAQDWSEARYDAALHCAREIRAAKKETEK